MAGLALHSTNSVLRERIVEHVFVGDALRTLWARGIVDVEVLRSEFDAHGYDLVMSRGSVVRHIQFKTGVRPRPVSTTISTSLAEKPSGCVLWISVSLQLDLGPYWWFGGEPGEPLPELAGYATAKRIGRRATGERPLRDNHRKVTAGAFKSLATMDEVLARLFGPDILIGLEVGTPDRE